MRKTMAPKGSEARKPQFEPSVVLRGVWTGLVAAAVTGCFLGGVMFAADLSVNRLPGMVPELFALFCAFWGGLAAGRRASGLGWMHGCAAGAGVVALLGLAGYLFSGEVESGVAFVRLLLGMVVGGISGVIAVNWD